jgi:ribonuclease HII
MPPPSPRPTADFRREAAAHAQGFRRVAGVDEAGRGPLAGPVTAAAVVLDPARIPAGLADSKTLPEPRRRALAAELARCADVSVAHATVDEIDALNILGATHLAMRRALAGLRRPPDLALIDGNSLPGGLGHAAETVVAGDALVLSIAAASICAKVSRDAAMVVLAQQFPGYGWERNAGYPTAEHRAALRRLGATPAHRRSFAPVHKILYQEEP